MTFTQDFPNIPLSEFDLEGVLYHANYFHLYEQTREAFLRAKGMGYPTLVSTGCNLAVVESRQEFLAPIRYGDRVEVCLWASDLKRTSVCCEYEIRKTDGTNNGRIIHRGMTKLAFVKRDANGFKLAKFPPPLAEAFADAELNKE